MDRELASTAGLKASDAASFAAAYQPLLGLWAVGGSPAAVQQLSRLAADLTALADVTCRRGRLHPLLGNTLVRPSVPVRR